MRAVVNPRPNGEEFESSLISDLIAKYHGHCSALGIRPVRFRKVEYGGNYEFQGFFTEKVDGREIGWHDVSWRKSVRPQSYESEVRAFLRRHIEPELKVARKDRCETCGRTDDLDVHHENPSFEEIYVQARAHFSPEEIKTRAYDEWLKKERFSLPKDHAVLAAFDAAHKSATLRTLCKAHHREAHASDPFEEE